MMESREVSRLTAHFSEMARFEHSEKIEFWYARELQIELGYNRWENFLGVISNAMQSCENAGGIIENHFREVTKMVLADFLPTLTIAAKNLATEMTNHNTEEANLQGERAITREHVQNNQSVRHMLGSRGIVPEELPPDEDIKKLERRVKSQEKKLASTHSFLTDGTE